MRSPVLLFLTLACVASLAHAQPATEEKPVRSPEVTHTGTSPTGYTVTFRYSNPTAKKVQIKGEWYFARPSEMVQTIPAPGFPISEGPGLMPKDWQPGDIPLIKFNPKDPYAIGYNWPIAEMTKGKNGVWTYTTPLPSGVFTYSFIVDCDPGNAMGVDSKPSKCYTENGAGTTTIPDPNNRAWTETKDGVFDGSIVHNSQVYVPSDANFDTVDYSWEGPAKRKGKLTHITYPSPGHLTPKDENYLVVYTPPNYDPARAKPYSTLYLSQGWGTSYEMNWATEALAGNILDNLINTGQIQPMVAVFGPAEDGFPGPPDDLAHGGDLVYFDVLERDLIDHAIPWVESHYHVSTSVMDRAYSGGGGANNSFILKHPEVFQYFGIMSSGLPLENHDTLSPSQIAALKGKSILLGGGLQDTTFAGSPPRHTGMAREVSIFAKAEIPVVVDFINGGHEYYVFRILLRDYLIHVAFRPLQYKVEDQSGLALATP